MVFLVCPKCKKSFRLTMSGTDEENEEAYRPYAEGKKGCPYCGYKIPQKEKVEFSRTVKT